MDDPPDSPKGKVKLTHFPKKKEKTFYFPHDLPRDWTISRSGLPGLHVSCFCRKQGKRKGSFTHCYLQFVLIMYVSWACAHYVMVSKFQWKPFWLATQRDPQNDWTATQNRVTYDVLACAQAPLSARTRPLHTKRLESMILNIPIELSFSSMK